MQQPLLLEVVAADFSSRLIGYDDQRERLVRHQISSRDQLLRRRDAQCRNVWRDASINTGSGYGFYDDDGDVVVTATLVGELDQFLRRIFDVGAARDRLADLFVVDQ